MSRLVEFDRMGLNLGLAKIYARLNRAERALCREFIVKHDALDVGTFEMTATRWYLDAPEKPKRLNEMVELLLAANHRARPPQP